VSVSLFVSNLKLLEHEVLRSGNRRSPPNKAQNADIRTLILALQTALNGLSPAQPLTLGCLVERAFLRINENGINTDTESGTTVPARQHQDSYPADMCFNKPFLLVVRQKGAPGVSLITVVSQTEEVQPDSMQPAAPVEYARTEFVANSSRGVQNDQKYEDSRQSLFGSPDSAQHLSRSGSSRLQVGGEYLPEDERSASSSGLENSSLTAGKQPQAPKRVGDRANKGSPLKALNSPVADTRGDHDVYREHGGTVGHRSSSMNGQQQLHHHHPQRKQHAREEQERPTRRTSIYELALRDWGRGGTGLPQAAVGGKPTDNGLSPDGEAHAYRHLSQLSAAHAAAAATSNEAAARAFKRNEHGYDSDGVLHPHARAGGSIKQHTSAFRTDGHSAVAAQAPHTLQTGHSRAPSHKSADAHVQSRSPATPMGRRLQSPQTPCVLQVEPWLRSPGMRHAPLPDGLIQPEASTSWAWEGAC
jgi:hypothetical protein